MLFPERLNLYIHASRQIELHQRVHGLLRRLENVEQAAYACGSQTVPAISCPRAANAALCTCSSSWAVELVPQSARRCAAPFPRSRPSTGPGYGSRRLSAGCEFFLFQSLFHLSNPSRHLRKERTGGKLQAALERRRPADCRAGNLPAHSPTAQSPRSCRLLPCGRLRESQTASPFPSLPA